MLQEDLDAKDYKDESACLDYIVKLNKEQLVSVEKKKTELQSIKESAPDSSSISYLIAFHDGVICILLKWFKNNQIEPSSY